MTDAELHHEWTLLNLSADRLEDELEYKYRTRYYSGEPYQVMFDLRAAQVRARALADNFYEQHAVRINKYLGKEICK